MTSTNQITPHKQPKRINTAKYVLPSSNSPDQNATSPRNYFPRTVQNTKIAHLRRAVRERCEQIVVYIQSEELASELQYYGIKGMVRVERQGIVGGKEAFVISNIQQFYLQYNSFLHSQPPPALTRLNWILLTKAINNAEIEKEFNQNYYPINFIILSDTQDIPNYFHFRKDTPTTTYRRLQYFSRIVNFGNYFNQLACVLQCGEQVEKHRPFDSRELWLLSKHQLKQLSTKPYRCYFLGEHSIKEEQIEVIESQSKLLFILVVDDYSICLHQAGIRQIEDSLTPEQIRLWLFNAQQKEYCQKVIENYLANQLVINLVNFPQQVAERFIDHVYVTQNMQSLGRRGLHVYSVYYGVKPQEDKLGISFNTDNDSLLEQILRIKEHFEQISLIQEQYEQVRQELSPFIIATYNLKESLCDQLQYFAHNKVITIQRTEQLNQLQNYHIILLTSTTLPNLTHNITIVHCPQPLSNIQVHQSLLTLINNLTAYHSSPLQYASTFVTNFTSQLSQIQQGYPYQRKEITDFCQFLRSMKENTSHIIILQMSEYSQGREQQLKEIELCKSISMEVYLLYGNEFISRNQNNKYTFLKKEQLLAKIQLIMTQHKSQEPTIDLQDTLYHSDLKDYREGTSYQTYSTPNLYCPTSTKSRIIICIPKGVPYYSLINRSLHPYTLLLYRRIEQASEMTKYIPCDSFAVIICLQGESQKVKSHNKHLYQLSIFQELGQKQLRKEVDKIIDRFALQRKKGNLTKISKKFPTVILYDHNQPKQIKAISKMNGLFQNSRLITMSKKQLRTIAKSYSIANGIKFYQVGKPQIKDAAKLTTVMQLFELYMSPFIGVHQYTSQKLQFSLKQLFIKQMLQGRRSKANRMSQITISRNLSPKSKHFLQKECTIAQPGLAIIQSHSLKLTNRQSFDDWQSLVSLSLSHLSKGKQIVVVVRQQGLYQLKEWVNVYRVQLIWIVIVSDFKKCIIREPNLVFCKEEHFEQTLALVTQKYQQFKKNSFQLSTTLKQQMPSLFNTSLSSHHNTFRITLASSLTHSYSSPTELTMYFNQSLKECPLQALQTAFAFNHKANLQYALSSFTTRPPQGNYQNDCLSIVCELHNKKFLQQALQLINQTNYLLVTLQHIGELLSYSSPCKTVFVIEKSYRIVHTHAMMVSPQETGVSFSRRLKVFLEGVRRY